MCAVSVIMDARTNDWQRRFWPDYIPVPFPVPPILPNPSVPFPTPTEIEDFRRLLEKARQDDREHNQPDCELDEKKRLLKAMADRLGVSIDFLETTPAE